MTEIHAFGSSEVIRVYPTLTEFLLARIAEDEQLASDARRYVGGAFGPYSVGAQAHVAIELWRHADHWTPARVLAECVAKRRIVAEHTPGPMHGDPCDAHDTNYETIPCGTLLFLALAYADHP